MRSPPGVGVAAVGVVFTGVAAVTVQLASTTRGAIGLAGAVLGVAFLLAGVGNMLGTPDTVALRVTSAWPAWLSPIGWAQQMRPFGGNHWWPLVLFLALFAVLLATGGGPRPPTRRRRGDRAAATRPRARVGVRCSAPPGWCSGSSAAPCSAGGSAWSASA